MAALSLLDSITSVTLKKLREETTPAAGHKERRISQSMKDVIHGYDQELTCEGSDLTCLRMFIDAHIDEFDFGDDLGKLADYAKKIAIIADHLNPSSSSLRGFCVSLTNVFRSYWVTLKGEQLDTGPHMMVIRECIHAPAARVKEVLLAKALRQTEKLSNIYTETWSDVERICLEWYSRGMSEDANREDIICLLLSVCLSTGARKTEVIDPNISFHRYESGNVDIGGIEIGPSDAIDELIGFSHLIIQSGTLKDTSTRVNKFIDQDDERFVAPKRITKPSIVLTSSQVVSAVKTFRKWTGITQKNFTDRASAGNRYGSHDMTRIMARYFPRAFSKSKAEKWNFSSHYCRKLYGSCVYTIYHKQISALSGKAVDRSILVGAVLGHDTRSQTTSLAYANVSVDFSLTDKELALPPDHLIRLLKGEIAALNARVEELERGNTREALIAQAPRTVQIEDRNGNMHSFPRHERVQYIDSDHRDTVIGDMETALEAKHVIVTYSVMARLGVSKQVYSAYKKGADRRPADRRPDRRSGDRALQSEGPASTAVLPAGDRVISSTNESESENTRRQALKRNIALFGERHVIENAEGCDGEIVHNKRIKTSKGREVVRDVCTV